MNADRPSPDAQARISATPRDVLGGILPAPGTKRWVIRRKAAVVDAVRKGMLTLDDACRHYNLSQEEFNSWQRLIDRHGPRGLRATRVKEYREIPTADEAPAKPR
ncbi:MAG: DUF1153 domain-containing protein [Rhodospirillales bacterium]|nr:DUF1153 domain-containing protein [Rhodospirillales bacterium]